MFKNYLKIALRNLWRNKVYAVINIFGLSVAIACAIVGYVQYDLSHSFDTFHANYDRIYRVTGKRVINNQEQRWGMVPIPLAQRMKIDFPQIKEAVCMEWTPNTMRHGDKVFHQDVLHADPGFFRMFSFPLKSGTADLNDKTKIVITETLAEKYFGTEDPIGKTLTLKYERGIERDFTVSGVVQKYPYHSSVRFEAVANVELLYDLGLNEKDSWRFWTHALFITAKHPEDVATVNNRMDGYLKLHQVANPNLAFSGFTIEPLSEVALNSRDTRNNALSQNLHPSQVIGLISISLLIVLMACFNYVNTSLAFAARRLKEIGVRKVIGGMRSQLITQFLIENIVMCMLALGLGLLLAEYFLPVIDMMFPGDNLSEYHYYKLSFMGFLAGMLMLTAVVAGLYPAVVSSSYNPVNILRADVKVGRIGYVMRTLLSFQFALSTIAVIGSIAFAVNTQYNKNFDLGYEKELVVTIPVNSEHEFTVLKNEIRDYPGITGIAGSASPIFFNPRGVIKSGAVEREANIYRVGFNYVEMMRLRLKSGRSFDEKTNTDTANAVMVNETLVRELGWDNAIGQTITINDRQYQVVGVLNDFYNRGTWGPITPVVMRVTPQRNYTMMGVLIRPENIQDTYSFLKDTWKRLFPHEPYQPMFQNPALAEALMITESITKLMISISVIAIAIAIMGLFALVSLTIARRTKEIGVRKVIGASVSHIVTLVNFEYIWLLVIGLGIANLAGYFLNQLLLDSVFYYNSGVGLWTIIGSNMVVLMIVIVTISSQVWNVATANPVDSLRYE